MFNNYKTEDKVSVLNSALNERYEALRVIRSRVENIGIWSLGVLIATGGWFFQTDTVFTTLEKTLFIIAVLSAFSVLRFKYLVDLNKGFKSQQKVTARLEKALGFYKKGVFDSEDTSIYPDSWQNAGKENGEGRFFQTTYLLLYTGVIFLVLAILLQCGYQEKQRPYFEHRYYQMTR